MGRTRRPAIVTALCVLGLAVAACSPGADLDTPDVEAPASPTTASATTQSLTPVTPDGLLTGPGVSDAAITLALVVAAEEDLGFGAGVRLWADSVNLAGGICGRTVQFVGGGDGADALATYEGVGRDVLGLVTLPAPGEAAALAERVARDQIPALTAAGASAGAAGPTLVAAPDDVQAINAAAYLLESDGLATGGSESDSPGGSLGVLLPSAASDTRSADAALEGVRWWADREGIATEVRRAVPSGPGLDDAVAGWQSTAVFSFAGPAATAALLAATPPATTVVMPLAQFDPDALAAAGAPTASLQRLLVMTPTPVLASEEPAVRAVAGALPVGADGAVVGAGPRTLSGYATVATWGRLLVTACADLALTRTGVTQALSSVGPAPADFLFGATDPARTVAEGRPATTVSALGRVDPALPGSLAEVTGLQSAPGIENYPE